MRADPSADRDEPQAARRRKSFAGWRSGCARRDRSWEHDRRIFDWHRDGYAVEAIVAERWCTVGRSQAYRIIARIRTARADKARMSEAERHARRCARGAWLRTRREHRARVWRRIEFGAPYEAPAFPARFRRQYPDRLAGRFRESHERFRGIATHAREPLRAPPLAWQDAPGHAVDHGYAGRCERCGTVFALPWQTLICRITKGRDCPPPDPLDYAEGWRTAIEEDRDHG